ncbi:mitochondrial carrier [Blomia tropicalis]|nr:mitochondrial carrier [Blomia tropicalis]
MEPKMPEKMLCAGMAACTADIVSFPLDVAKVRLQISTSMATNSNGIVYRGLFGTIFGMIKHEGFTSLYGGISPGLQRQCLFASIRIGLYDPVKEFYTNLLHLDSQSSSSIMLVRIASAITTGAIGISVAQPTDVVKVRMQAQSRGIGAVKYNSSIHAYKTIYGSEGLRGLWKGLGPNIARNSMVNAAELVCYDTVKESIIAHHWLVDGFPCHFCSAFSGLCTKVACSPDSH